MKEKQACVEDAMHAIQAAGEGVSVVVCQIFAEKGNVGFNAGTGKFEDLGPRPVKWCTRATA